MISDHILGWIGNNPLTEQLYINIYLIGYDNIF